MWCDQVASEEEEKEDISIHEHVIHQRTEMVRGQIIIFSAPPSPSHQLKGHASFLILHLLSWIITSFPEEFDTVKDHINQVLLTTHATNSNYTLFSNVLLKDGFRQLNTPGYRYVFLVKMQLP